MLNKMKSCRAVKNFLQFLLFYFILTQHCFAQWFWQNPLPLGHELRSVNFVSSNVGWAVGYCGTIIKTTDGGINWTQQTSGTNTNLFGVHFADENFGAAVGGGYPYDATIVRTTNGGIIWEAFPMMPFRAIISL